MISVELHDIIIHAVHGIYEGEEKTGNPYIVNLSVKFEESTNDMDDLNNTVDYVDLYEIINRRMQVHTHLLEKLCEAIIRHIKHQYPFIKEANLSIHKLQAPIHHFQGRVGVSMNKKFND